MLHACVRTFDVTDTVEFFWKLNRASSQKNFYSTRHIEFLDTCMEYQMQFEKKVITQYKCLHEMNILSLISL